MHVQKENTGKEMPTNTLKHTHTHTPHDQIELFQKHKAITPGYKRKTVFYLKIRGNMHS